jgi:hypothetical protein
MPQTRISHRAHQVLRRLSRETGQSSEQILDSALEALERKQLLDAINEGFAALKAQPEEWKKELEERELWDATSGDGDAP